MTPNFTARQLVGAPVGIAQISSERRSGIKQVKIKLFFEKLGVPVGDVDGIQKGHPFLVAGHAKGFLHKRCPLRLNRPSHERHIGLVRRPTTLAAVTIMTGTNDILPHRHTTLGARQNMVEIQLVPRQSPAAVLTGTFIPSVNVVAAETDLSFGYTVIAD